MAKKLVKFPNQCQQMKFCNKQNASKICKTLILRKNVIIEKESKRGSSFITVCDEKAQKFVWPTIYSSAKIFCMFCYP